MLRHRNEVALQNHSSLLGYEEVPALYHIVIQELRLWPVPAACGTEVALSGMSRGRGPRGTYDLRRWTND